MMEIPIEWVLGVIISLGGVIGTLATIMWNMMKGRLAAQDIIIKRLQDDIDRLSKGCGLKTCIWKNQ